ESLSWVQSHIAACLKTYAKCSDATQTVLPSRVLSLGKAANGSIEVSLKETDNARGVHACLSHRWGGSESDRATRSSYASMLEGIAWDSIPRTFQDAMQFAVSLGIENIWIDSFCIIQDDIVDWQEQAAHMASIYQNSYVTLATTTSLNSEAGCFWDSDASYERKFSVELFQERLLAPRVLHFSRHELF
ncbi:heterokaryon incompatibility protein-domain-containing protein, partial [Leptodontidium sp. 2 PMI_412]